MRALVKRDLEIQQQVMQELRWDTRVEASNIGVEVTDGVVTLSGTVTTYPQKIAAQESAHRVIGVLDVANDLQVHLGGGHARTDADIAQAVRHTLEWTVLVPSDNVHTTVTNGWVTLEGSVSTWRQRLDAESAVRYLTGVSGVTNKIVVAAPEVEAYQVRQAIETALERRAEREAKRIQVEVKNGVVTLTGWVRTWLEKQSILGAAGHAPGIRDVVDRLQIDPYM
jgi:osmotically-inducible protein OsmY